MKDIKELKEPHVYGLEELILLRWQYSQNDRFSKILIKIPGGFFFLQKLKSLPKNHMDIKGPRIAKTILKKKNKVVGLILLNLKTQHKATLIKKVGYCIGMDIKVSRIELSFRK